MTPTGNDDVALAHGHSSDIYVFRGVTVNASGGRFQSLGLINRGRKQRRFSSYRIQERHIAEQMEQRVRDGGFSGFAARRALVANAGRRSATQARSRPEESLGAATNAVAGLFEEGFVLLQQRHAETRNGRREARQRYNADALCTNKFVGEHLVDGKT
jgi:hypothetical protein